MEKRKYIEPDIITAVKGIDILTYLRQYEPGELVRCGNNSYCLRSHDSFKISNGKWFWHSRGIGGRSALDYLIKVKGMDFYDAVCLLIGNPDNVKVSYSFNQNTEAKTEKIFKLPEKNSDNRRMELYLMSRGISPKVIEYCVGCGLLYEDKKHHNAVFVGLDERMNPVHASFRATIPDRIMGDIAGSDKRYAFRLEATGEPVNTVHVFESAVDLLSYATILQMHKKDFTKKNLLSLDGISGKKMNEKNTPKMPVALEKYLENHPGTEEIILHLDNDEAGKIASENIKKICENFVNIKNSPPIFGKDVNDFLVRILTNSD